MDYITSPDTGSLEGNIGHVSLDIEWTKKYETECHRDAFIWYANSKNSEVSLSGEMKEELGGKVKIAATAYEYVHGFPHISFRKEKVMNLDKVR